MGSKSVLNTESKEYIRLLYGRFYPVVVTVRFVGGKLYAFFEQMSPDWCKDIEFCEDLSVSFDNGGFNLQEREEFMSFMLRHISLMKDVALGRV